AADVDEGAVAGDPRHGPLHGGAGLEPDEELFALACTVLVLRRLLADDQPVALAVDLEDLDRDPLADERFEAARARARHLARAQEPAQAEAVAVQPAIVLL